MLFNHDFSSPNYEERQKDIKYVIFHYTELTFDRALEKLTNQADTSKVSAHFLIRKDGEIFQLVAEENTAWHAGLSYWRGEDKINHSSIGIEIDNLGNEEFTAAQIYACLNLCFYLKAKYQLETDNFLGHSDIAPDRKIDPGFYFPWKLFAVKGFGTWPTQDITSDSGVLYKFGDEGSHISELQSNLQKFGYKIEVTQKFDQHTNRVVRAFLSRFCAEDLELSISIADYFNPETKYYWNKKAQLILASLINTINN